MERTSTATVDREGAARLAGRAVLITGGGRGIGAASAIALAEAGATVALAARNEAQVVDVAAMMREDGLKGFAFRCDVTDPRQVRDLALSAREAMGRVDIMINNARTATSNPLGRITLAEWEHMMDVNAKGTYLCTQAVFDGMVEQGWGRIVNVASLAGLEGDRYIAAYAAAEHAIIGFTKAVAAEAEGTGVAVHAVCPGYVDTPLTDETIARIMHLTGQSWHEALRSVLDQAGQARLIRAQEVAEGDRRALCGAEGRAQRRGRGPGWSGHAVATRSVIVVGLRRRTERHGVADPDDAVVHDDAVHAATPPGIERLRQPGTLFIHALAGPRLTQHEQAHATERQHSIASAVESDSAHHQVRSPHLRRRIGERLTDAVEDLLLDDRDLAS